MAGTWALLHTPLSTRSGSAVKPLPELVLVESFNDFTLFLPVGLVALQRRIVVRFARCEVVVGVHGGPGLFDRVGDRNFVGKIRYRIRGHHLFTIARVFRPVAAGIGMRMTSLWRDWRSAPTEFGAIPHAEVTVVGAGLTGPVTAALLARGDKRVVVPEAPLKAFCSRTERKITPAMFKAGTPWGTPSSSLYPNRGIATPWREPST